MGNSWKPRFHELEHESKIRLLKTHSHPSERQGYKAGNVRQKTNKERRGLAVRNRNKPPTKVIAMPLATWSRARKCLRKSEKLTQKARRSCAPVSVVIFIQIAHSSRAGGGSGRKREEKKHGIRQNPPKPRPHFLSRAKVEDFLEAHRCKRSACDSSIARGPVCIPGVLCAHATYVPVVSSTMTWYCIVCFSHRVTM